MKIHPPICRHCRKMKACRPRRLCWTCYYQPGVREMYPPVGKAGLAGASGWRRFSEPPLPTSPTTAAPGSPEKLAVLCTRAKLSQALFHPADGPDLRERGAA